RPVMGLEQVERLLADASNSLAGLLRISFDEIFHEQSNITTPIAKRRDLNRNDIEPVEQVGAEDPVPDGGREVSVRRRQHSDIDDNRLVSPHTFELSLLKHAQHGDLRSLGQLADFIQKDGPAVGRLESTEASLQRSGKRALLVAEQLRRNQRLRNRGAVDANERTTRSPGAIVDRTGDELFTHSGLTLDQNRRVARRYFRDLIQNRP